MQRCDVAFLDLATISAREAVIGYWLAYSWLLLVLVFCILHAPSARFLGWFSLGRGTRLLLVCVSAALAGIPPFCFFFFKLSLLLALGRLGLGVWFLGLLVMIFVGWYTYWQVVRGILLDPLSWTDLRSAAFPPLMALTLFLSFSLLLISGALLVDVNLVARWLLS